jgi:8-oxo-dGTP diphosphatase
MDKVFKIGCNVVVVKGGKVLMGKRKNITGEGTWGIPGGHLEIDENLIDGATRELMEEIGVEVGREALEFLSVTESNRQEKAHYVQVNFVLKDFEGEVKNMEPEKCEEWKFVDPKDESIEIFAPHINILKSYLENKKYVY